MLLPILGRNFVSLDDLKKFNQDGNFYDQPLARLSNYDMDIIKGSGLLSDKEKSSIDKGQFDLYYSSRFVSYLVSFPMLAIYQ